MPPVLSLFRMGAHYILRVFDTSDTRIAATVVGSLPDADSILIVTPNDTKLFMLGAGEHAEEQQRIGRRIVRVDETETVDEVPDSLDEAMQLADTAGEDMEDQAAAAGLVPPRRQVVAEPAEEELTESVEVAPGVVRRPKRNAADNSPNSACGRCNGTGMIAMLMEGGAAAQGYCPVCKGKGYIRLYGARAPQR